MYALIKDEKVVQLSTDKFEVHPSMTWCDVPTEIQNIITVGWSYNNSVLSAPIINQNDLIINQIKELEAKLTQRRLRECFNPDISISDPAIQFVNDIESQITNLRSQLV